MPQARAILGGLPASTGLVMLGDLLIADPFYRFANITCRVIPHGYFEIESPILTTPVIIGSHTTWGEMRSIERAAALLKEVAVQSPRTVTLGYLGGAPANALNRSSVTDILEKLQMADLFTLRNLDRGSWKEQIAQASSNTIFLRPGGAPHNFDVTFNLQLYHYGECVRLGESSGSLHASSGIPVILEMNGSERIEQIRTVKVPYSDPARVESADLRTAAQDLLSLVNSGEYLDVLRYNHQMALKWNYQTVAGLYVGYLKMLGKS